MKYVLLFLSLFFASEMTFANNRSNGFNSNVERSAQASAPLNSWNFELENTTNKTVTVYIHPFSKATEVALSHAMIRTTEDVPALYKETLKPGQIVRIRGLQNKLMHGNKAAYLISIVDAKHPFSFGYYKVILPDPRSTMFARFTDEGIVMMQPYGTTESGLSLTNNRGELLPEDKW